VNALQPVVGDHGAGGAVVRNTVPDTDQPQDSMFPVDPGQVPPTHQQGRTVTCIHGAPRNPLEVILSGREAAGCSEGMQLVCGETSATARDEQGEYLCFRVSDETYGIDIMDIKEIITTRTVTEVPRAPSFISGIISLRGIIIPIIDMAARLGLRREAATGRERVIVVRQGETFSGLLVDEVIQVVPIARNCFEPAPAVLAGSDRDFVSGVGRADGRMIILLNPEKITDANLL
jgi:purine-binding chemotaxis protein CheW